MPAILEVDSVIKSFGQKQVLTDIYLQCRTGDILGLLGRNGAGKSTLLKIIFGTLPAENKFIRIDGKSCSRVYREGNSISFLPQFNFLPKNLTVEKAAELYQGNTAQPSILDDPLLSTVRKSKIAALSGGELRYLEIKLVLSMPSKFVFLDEPFNGCAPVLIEKINEYITAASKTKGIILTDHDYRNVLGVANRYCLLHDGGLKTIHDPEELIHWGYLPPPGS